jgi:hemerythrin-like metal-binding protein
MALITWNPALEVGVKEIDAQHKRLVDLVNQLNDAMRLGQGRDKIGPVLNELVRYTVSHFATEERFMDAHRYALSANHKAEHKKLLEDVGAFKAKFDSGNANLSIEVLQFLRDWLSKHIMGTDKKLGGALNEKGIK